MKVGITGQAGFVGGHLYNELGLDKGFERIAFRDEFFGSESSLDLFVEQCDVIVHLAAVNRAEVPDELYRINVELTDQLIASLKRTKSKAMVLFSSSIQESLDNPYGKAKKLCREKLENWATENQGSFLGLIIPNVYGPFGRPNYNSFVATFCNRLVNEDEPVVIQDNSVNLIYVGSLCKYIIKEIQNPENKTKIQTVLVEQDFERKVTEILEQLKMFKSVYQENGFIPELRERNDINLFNTFRSYIDPAKQFPVLLRKYEDERGYFVETMKVKSEGQISFSTTHAGITRGNHYHTRKIERFTVLKGKARISFRNISNEQVYDFILDGEHPSYVDMPIWFTHNITNIGDEDLYTQFWINEWFDPADPDTYFEQV